jgi:hypothetical protein
LVRGLGLVICYPAGVQREHRAGARTAGTRSDIEAGLWRLRLLLARRADAAAASDHAAAPQRRPSRSDRRSAAAWTARIEYDHTDVSGATITFPTVAVINAQRISVRQWIDVVKLGVNYKFH